MSKRGTLRRKVVLPVTIIRRNGEEKQLAHTLDITGVSARLGGLGLLLDPGEIIELQRGGVKAKFQVHWVGEPTSTLAGQAGIRGIDPNKSIWGIQLPADEPDIIPVKHKLYVGDAASQPAAVEPEQHAQYACSGLVMLRTPGSNYPMRVHLKTIHVGGLYVETLTALPLNTVVAIEANVEGIQFEIAGAVTSSVPRVGMDLAFHKVSPENKRKILQVVQKLKQKVWDEQQVPCPPLQAISFSPGQNVVEITPHAEKLRHSYRAFVDVCENLAADFEDWKAERSADELAALQKAVTELHRKLSLMIEPEEPGYVTLNVSSGEF